MYSISILTIRQKKCCYIFPVSAKLLSFFTTGDGSITMAFLKGQQFFKEPVFSPATKHMAHCFTVQSIILFLGTANTEEVFF